VPDSALPAAPAGLKVSRAQQTPGRPPYSRARGQIFVGRAGDGYHFNGAFTMPCERQRLRNVRRSERDRAGLIRDQHRIQRRSQVLVSGSDEFKRSIEFNIGHAVFKRACQRAGKRPTIRT
jgi:hypothetical protein